MKTDITPALAPRRETIITTIYLYTYTKYVQYYIHQVLISINKIQIHLKYVGRETLESSLGCCRHPFHHLWMLTDEIAMTDEIVTMDEMMVTDEMVMGDEMVRQGIWMWGHQWNFLPKHVCSSGSHEAQQTLTPYASSQS